MKGLFQGFDSPVQLGHHFWKHILQKHHTAIDATCGGGRDTRQLARLCSRVLSLDIQAQALERARALLTPDERKRVEFYLQSHESFPDAGSPIQLIVYNLGYLPGASKSLTTRVCSTLTSFAAALGLIAPGGFVSITCYPGHEEGAREQEALLEVIRDLDPRRFTASHHTWTNRNRAPSLFSIQKISR